MPRKRDEIEKCELGVKYLLLIVMVRLLFVLFEPKYRC